jgi:hypothetical protein
MKILEINRIIKYNNNNKKRGRERERVKWIFKNKKLTKKKENINLFRRK